MRVFHEDSFLGSAVYFGNGCFLTCQHVAKHRRRFRIQLKAKPDAWLDVTLAPNEIDHELDLAVLRAQSNEPLAPPGARRSAPAKERFIKKEEFQGKLLNLGDQDIGRAPNWAKRLRKEIEERAGLLIGVDDDSLKFPHRSFQEFFAGKHIARPRVLAERGRALLEEGEHWDEVVRWAAGIMADVSGFLEEVVDLLSELIRTEDNDGKPLPLNPRLLLVASEIAREAGVVRLGKKQAGKDCLRNLRECLLAQFPDAQAPGAMTWVFASSWPQFRLGERERSESKERKRRAERWRRSLGRKAREEPPVAEPESRSGRRRFGGKKPWSALRVVRRLASAETGDAREYTFRQYGPATRRSRAARDAAPAHLFRRTRDFFRL